MAQALSCRPDDPAFPPPACPLRRGWAEATTMDFNSRRLILVALALAALTGGACDEPTEAESLLAELGPATLERVVLARMYQRDGWVISAVDPEIDRAGAAQYVCDAIAPLHPTYVSG